MPEIRTARQIDSLEVNPPATNLAEFRPFALGANYVLVCYASDYYLSSDTLQMDLFKIENESLSFIDNVELDLGTSLSLNQSFQPAYYLKGYPLGDGRWLFMYSATGEESWAYWVFKITNDTIDVTTSVTTRTWPMQFGATHLNNTLSTVAMLRSINSIVFVAAQGKTDQSNTRATSYIYGVEADFTTNTPSFGSVRTKTGIGDHRYYQGNNSGVPLDNNYVLYEWSLNTGSGFGQQYRRTVIWNWAANTVSYTDSTPDIGGIIFSTREPYYIQANGKKVWTSLTPATDIANISDTGWQHSWMTFTPPSTITRSNPAGTWTWSGFFDHEYGNDMTALFVTDFYDEEDFENSTGLHMRLYDDDGEYAWRINMPEDIDPDDWDAIGFSLMSLNYFVFLAYDSFAEDYTVELYTWDLVEISSFVKRLSSSQLTTFAGSLVAPGDEDGPALTTARFSELSEIAALSASPQRAPVIPGTNKYYVWDDDKVKLIHPCEELVQTTFVLVNYNNGGWSYQINAEELYWGFEDPDYSVSSWPVGSSPFGAPCRPQAVTNWPTFDGSELVARRELGPVYGSINIHILVDDNVQVWMNGTEIYSESIFTGRAYGVPVGPIAVPKQILDERNVLAIRAHDIGAGCNGFAMYVEMSIP